MPRTRFQAFDLLSSLVAVVDLRGQVIYANAALEDALGASRRAIESSNLCKDFVEPQALQAALDGVAANAFASLRYDALLQPHGSRLAAEPIPVHVIITQTEDRLEVIVEMLPQEAQEKLDREERNATQALANKELIRNLAHEIKNPLGGIRGAAQLLQLELSDTEKAKSLTEYTQVIIHEADRLQTLVDRLLEPHRKPREIGDVNIHEVCERVRSLIVAEFPKGLKVVRDYDTSIPDFRGDKEQLIQTVLNIAHNAAQVLPERMAEGDARIVFKTRIARQVTLGKRRHRLALELHIQDNGPGIPPEIKDRIFYPLVSGREGGSGLGLTLAQTFVQQHEGLIEVESQPGRTEFKITIPLP
ncbi:nitrogen regulation protein NR(II) [Variovorax sp. PCZ-1]|uniref:nitrogen regulation protein NR(II) n=1 Tax=Variovorax sp. PCZ-1 TaxID=2835533 RepID=UPI001BCEE79A|nr:nitrogen regulation protein NR(II) [Variovorax sp. PCZ-1]MBS7807400.1 PAS domain-containing sensor histidine kinase [Variovorax sp. PCZ-1]